MLMASAVMRGVRPNLKGAVERFSDLEDLGLSDAEEDDKIRHFVDDGQDKWILSDRIFITSVVLIATLSMIEGILHTIEAW